MATAEYEGGDTIRFNMAYTDLPSNGGAAIDPDGQVATFTVYDIDMNQVGSPIVGTRTSLGNYYVDYTVPSVTELTFYFYEWSADFNSNPQIKRVKFKVKFNVAD